MKAIITNKIILLKNAELIKNDLQEKLSFIDKSKKYQLNRLQKNPFLRNSPQVELLKKDIEGCLLKEIAPGCYAMSSGFYYLLDDYSLEIEDRRCDTGDNIILPWINKPHDPRDYQEEAISEMLKVNRGIVNFSTGLGKTLTAIHFMKRFKKKTLILVPTESIATQFYDEAIRAFGQHKVGMFGNGKKKIADITVGIIASVNKNTDKFKNAKLGCIISDECFPYDTFINTNSGPMKIGKLVQKWENGLELPLIKSFNQTTKQFEFKKMTYGWRKQKEDLVYIKASKKKIKCTSNHKLLTTDGWKEASTLKEGDLLIGEVGDKQDRYICPTLNEDQMQVLIGSYLGDGHLDKIGHKRYRLTETHCKKQKDYIQWKADIFNVNNLTHIEKNGYAQKEAYRLTTRCFDIAEELPKTKTECPDWMIDRIKPKALAIWFMDDGNKSINSNAAKIATCSFDEKTQDKLVLKLQSMGIDCKKTFTNHTGLRAPGYWQIVLSKKGLLRLSELVEPYIHKSMEYKIVSKNIPKYNWNNTESKVGTVPVDFVKNIKNKVCKGRTPFVFDIEVEDNHNFSVCSETNTSGIIAHNCHHFAAETFYGVINDLGDVGRIYGLTATDYRSDGKDIMINGACGPTIIKRDIIWGISNGWLVKPKFLIKEIPTIGKDSSSKIHNYKTHVLSSNYMKDQILKDIQDCIRRSKTVLCLVAEVEHGEELSKQLGIPFAQGSDPKSQEYVDLLNKKKIPALIGTAGKVGEGTDTKAVDVLILASFPASKGILIQSIGRGLRIFPEKTDCEIYDYIPTGSEMLKRHAYDRIKIYKELSQDIKIQKSNLLFK